MYEIRIALADLKMRLKASREIMDIPTFEYKKPYLINKNLDFDTKTFDNHDKYIKVDFLLNK